MRLLLLLLAGLAATVPIRAAETVVLAPMEIDEARLHVLAWVAEQPTKDPARTDRLKTLWAGLEPGDSAEELLEVVVQSFAIFDEPTARLLGECQLPALSLTPPSADVLKRPGLEEFYLQNLRLYYGRYLADRLMYDEASDVLQSTDVRHVVDPASLLFYRAVAAQAVLNVKPALAAIDQLLKQTEGVPVRYRQTAILMQAELAELEEKSLGEIARLMSDSERRLDLGRSGEKVQGVQDRIIADLDELIKKIEQQQGGGGGGGGSSGNSNESNSAADDSRVKGTTAPGEVDKKDFSKQGRWGDLPEKEQAKAQNLINRNFPSHYRQAIESYFKKLANRPAKPAGE